MNSLDFRNALMGHAVRFEQNNAGKIARINGVRVQIGDIVDFKSDTEQQGKVTKIEGDRLTLQAPSDSGFIGDYIHGQPYTTQLASDCFGLNGE